MLNGMALDSNTKKEKLEWMQDHMIDETKEKWGFLEAAGKNVN